jgi:hypothetical protein
VRTAQLAHQNHQPRGKPMTKTKAIRMPGKERPATSQSRIQGLRRRSLTIGILVKNTKPSAIWLVSQTAEGLDRRFLRSQPRVLGPGSLRKARPRRSDYQFNTKAKTTCPDAYPSRGYNVRQGSNRMGNNKLAAGDRVRVSDHFFWAKGATGTIAKPPDAVTALSGAMGRRTYPAGEERTRNKYRLLGLVR